MRSVPKASRESRRARVGDKHVKQWRRSYRIGCYNSSLSPPRYSSLKLEDNTLSYVPVACTVLSFCSAFSPGPGRASCLSRPSADPLGSQPTGKRDKTAVDRASRYSIRRNALVTQQPREENPALERQKLGSSGRGFSSSVGPDVTSRAATCAPAHAEAVSSRKKREETRSMCREKQRTLAFRWSHCSFRP